MKTNRLLLFAIALFAFFPFNVFAATEITKLDLIFDEIEEGANPDLKVEVIASNADGSATLTIEDVEIKWVNLLSDTELAETNVFEDGIAYSINLSAAGLELINEKIEEAGYSLSNTAEYYYNGEQYEYKFFVVNGIEEIYIDLETLYVGATLPSSMTFSYIINGEEFEGTSESITWYKYSESGDIELPSNSVIEARNYYSFTIFPGDSIIKRLDGRTIIYINGEDYSIGEDGDYYEAVDPMTDVNTVYDLFTNVETALEGNDGNALIQAVDAMMEKIDVYNNLSDYQLDLLAEKLNLADRATAFDYILDKWIDANTTVSALKLINAYVANPTKDTATELVDYIDSYKEMYGNTLNIEKYYNNLNKTYEEAVVKMVGVSNPNTFDGISSSILFGFISLAGIAGSVICLKGKANA